MKLKAWIWMLCVTGLCASCDEVAGNFCDIAEPDRYKSSDVLEYLLVHDPDHVRADTAENVYGEENCGWKFG